MTPCEANVRIRSRGQLWTLQFYFAIKYNRWEFRYHA